MGEKCHTSVDEGNFLPAPQIFVDKRIFTAVLRRGKQNRFIPGFIGKTNAMERDHNCLNTSFDVIISQLFRFLNKKYKNSLDAILFVLFPARDTINIGKAGSK